MSVPSSIPRHNSTNGCLEGWPYNLLISNVVQAFPEPQFDASSFGTFQYECISLMKDVLPWGRPGWIPSKKTYRSLGNGQTIVEFGISLASSRRLWRSTTTKFGSSRARQACTPNWRVLSGRGRKMHLLHKSKSGRSVYSKIRSKICNVDPQRLDSYQVQSTAPSLVRAVGFKFRLPLKMWGACSISSRRAW